MRPRGLSLTAGEQRRRAGLSLGLALVVGPSLSVSVRSLGRGASVPGLLSGVPNLDVHGTLVAVLAKAGWTIGVVAWLWQLDRRAPTASLATGFRGRPHALGRG